MDTIRSLPPPRRFHANLLATSVLHSVAFCDYDAVVITEFPTNFEAAAIAVAFAGSGRCKNVKTTPLLSAEFGSDRSA